MSSMLPFSYFCFGCIELANNARLSKYVGWAAANGQWSDANCCVEMPRECWCPTDGTPDDFVDPITDDACWIDPEIPESSEFLGMFVTNVRGLRDSAFTRSASQNIGHGVTLGRDTVGSRSFAVEAFLVATSCCGMDYGFEFVKRILENGGCGNGSCLQGCGDLGSCGLTCMTVRTCCPESEGDDNGLRQWVNVGVVEGLKESDEQSASCECCLFKVTFTIQSETPESYSVNPEVCLDKDVDLDNVVNRCFDWTSCESEDNSDLCTTDPLCTNTECVLPSPPNRVNTCFCEPLQVAVDCCCATDQANARDETYRIVIDTGKNPTDADFVARGMRNLRVKFYNGNPLLPCPSDDEESLALWSTQPICAALEVPYLKAGSQLVIDGRTENITVQCDNKCYPGYGSVFGVDGSDPFPLLSSCNGVVICVEWDMFSTQFELDTMNGIVPAHVKIERFKVYG